jgi:hypothetical protein
MKLAVDRAQGVSAAQKHSAPALLDRQRHVDRSRCRDRQGPPGLHHLYYSWRMGSWPDHETRGGPDHLRWFWSFTVTCPMTHSDRASTLEEAKVQLQKSWDAWKAWAGPVTMKSPGTARMVSVVMSNVGLAGWTVGRGPSRPRC